MSILDQVRKTEFEESIAGFNPVATLNMLFSKLNEKERDVIKSRYGLDKIKKETLEQIGVRYGITRERVRQIEKLSIKKLKELRELKEGIKNAENVVEKLLERYGGIMEEEFFLEHILSYLDAHEDSDKSLLFLVEHIFSDNIQNEYNDGDFERIWRIGDTDISFLKQVIAELVNIIEEHGKPIKLEKLLHKFKNGDFYIKNKDRLLSIINYMDIAEEDVDKILESYLRACKIVKQDLFGKWGMKTWGTVEPKRINDKIYLVLKKAGKPLHFTEIANMINEVGFDEKVAYPATVHNELILDNKYVLVGRGIYALREWGYESGTVSQVVENILKTEGPLEKKDIYKKVLDQRNVKESTIYLSLMNNKKIIRNKDGKFELLNDDSAL